MKTLKLKTTWLKEAEALSDAEMGRLIRGMLKYASTGEEPNISGNERVMWPKAREDVDEQRGSHERQQAGNITRHNEASCGITRHNAALCGIEKAPPYSPPTPPVITPCKEIYTPQKKTSPKGEVKEKPLRGTFTPPTESEVRAYCLERGNQVDAARFVDYYTANGWKVGKNPMKDWKAAVRTWERTDDKKPGNDRYAALKKLMEETPDD